METEQNSRNEESLTEMSHLTLDKNIFDHFISQSSKFIDSIRVDVVISSFKMRQKQAIKFQFTKAVQHEKENLYKENSTPNFVGKP